MLDLDQLCQRAAAWARARLPCDAAHDAAHLCRVADWAERIGRAEGADLAVVLPAAWLHDCVSLAKDHPERNRSSSLAAEAAGAWLHEQGQPAERVAAIQAAIRSHSFSAGIPAESLEAQVVQDADRLDALGAIGIARCLLCGGALGRPLYDPADPLCSQRAPDDDAWCIDHFFRKLFPIANTLHTASARAEAQRRVAVMRRYLADLAAEIR